MGRLVRSIIMDEAKDAFIGSLIIKPEMIPELMLLGEMEHKRIPLDDGRLFDIDIIHYEGKQYVMREENVGRWFDER